MMNRATLSSMPGTNHMLEALAVIPVTVPIPPGTTVCQKIWHLTQGRKTTPTPVSQRIYSKIYYKVSGLGQRRERSVRGYCSNHVNQHQVTVSIRKLYTGRSLTRKYTFRSGTADL